MITKIFLAVLTILVLFFAPVSYIFYYAVAVVTLMQIAKYSYKKGKTFDPNDL